MAVVAVAGPLVVAAGSVVTAALAGAALTAGTALTATELLTLGAGLVAAAGIGATVVGGGIAAHCGQATMYEGVQDAALGMVGSDIPSYNYIRDGLFGGDQQRADGFQDFGRKVMFTGGIVTFSAINIHAILLQIGRAHV